MMRTRLLVVVATVLAVTGCALRGARAPHPLDDQTRYLCCNLHYEKTTITDANYLRGTLVPFGTQVRVIRVTGHEVQFQPTGHPTLGLVHKLGRKVQPMDQYLDRLFLPTDPRAKVRPPGKRDTEGARLEKLVAQGEVDKGMSRDQLLRALGYPPTHRTPTLESPSWTYWQNRWATMVVHFDGDKVVRIER